jgi:serine/threonine protein kinase
MDSRDEKTYDSHYKYKEKKEKKNLSKKIEFANELQLDQIINTLSKDGKPLTKKSKLDLENVFNEKNDKLAKINKVVGNNNIVLILDKNQTAILICETKQQVRAMVASITEHFGSTPGWLAKEYRVDTSSIESKRYKKNTSYASRTYRPEHNEFDMRQFISVSIIEAFPDSLLARVKEVTKVNDDEANMRLVCNMGKQVCGMLDDLKKAGCLWTDLKPGNILIRENDSIGVADIKAFQLYEQALVMKCDSPYENISCEWITKTDEEFSLKVDRLEEGQFLIKTPKNMDDGIDFCVSKNNEKIKGKITLEELKAKVNDEKKYEIILRKLTKDNDAFSLGLNMDESRHLFSIASEKIGSVPVNYKVYYLDVTDVFTSTTCDSVRDKRYPDPKTARQMGFEMWNKEYSYQLAILLYFMATGIEKGKQEKFDFNKPIFRTIEGQALQKLIIELSVEKMENRKTIEEAYAILSHIENKYNMDKDLDKEKQSPIHKRGLFAKTKSLSKSIIERSYLKEKTEQTPEVITNDVITNDVITNNVITNSENCNLKQKSIASQAVTNAVNNNNLMVTEQSLHNNVKPVETKISEEKVSAEIMKDIRIEKERKRRTSMIKRASQLLVGEKQISEKDKNNKPSGYEEKSKENTEIDQRIKPGQK